MKCYTRKVGGPDAAIALGTFDGVHLGHQTVLEVAQTIALCEGLTPCALSFLNHPLSVVGAGAPPLLTLPAEKALLAARCGLEALVLLPFTRELAALPAGKLLPRFGVYFGYVHIAGQRHRAMFNLGVKPTVGSDRPTLEAYLLDFSGDLYGAAARVSFVARIRDERRFDSIEALSAQIARDVETARRF